MREVDHSLGESVLLLEPPEICGVYAVMSEQFSGRIGDERIIEVEDDSDDVSDLTHLSRGQGSEASTSEEFPSRLDDWPPPSSRRA